MMRRNTFWKLIRMAVPAVVIAAAIATVAHAPAEARDGHWSWNGSAYVWIYEPYPPAYYNAPAYDPYYYPPAYGYYGYPPAYYYGPGVSFGVRIH